MRTSHPPSERAKDAVDPASQPPAADYRALCEQEFPLARRIAVLSLIPGLGQLRNGEFGKGTLFLAVMAANVALIAACAMPAQLQAGLSFFANAFHRELTMPKFIGTVAHSPVVYIYGALLALFVAYAIRDAYDRAVERIRDGRHHSRFTFSLPEAASGSYLGHLAIITSFILLLVCFISPPPPTEQVTQIELMKEPAPKQKEPDKPKQAPKPLPKPKPVVEQPKPKPVVQQVQPKPVKVEQPKPTPVAVAVPSDKPSDVTTAPITAPEAAPAPVAAAPTSGGGGSPTGTGNGGGGGGGDIDMGPYMRDLQRKIKKAWFPPKGPESKRIKVSFKVHKDGTISKLKLVTSSGIDVEDEAATTAVENAAPFAPLPAGAGDEVDINFTFDYTVFNGGGRSFR
jgi:TonB family protein